MRKNLPLILTFSTLLAVPAWAGGGIVATQENGRTIYVEDPTPPKPPAASPAQASPATSNLVYWSRNQHRWIPVKSASPAKLRAARSAAAEVNSTAANGILLPATQGANPRYRVLTAAELDKLIDETASRHGVDPNLVRAVIKVESNFDPRAVSRKGAMGLMQLMPTTARKLNVANPFDPQQNLEGGVRHLSELLSNYNGDVPLSLAAYNAGAGAVERSNGIPHYTETRNYVRRITELYGSGGGLNFRSLSGVSAPIRVYRNAEGVLTFSNVE